MEPFSGKAGEKGCIFTESATTFYDRAFFPVTRKKNQSLNYQGE